jgi:apolipoprotein N-acyltransferase
VLSAFKSLDAPRTRAALAFLSGLIFAASSPPFNAQSGILIGLFVFAFALHEAPTNKSAAWRGFLFGLGANLEALRFVPEVITRFTPLPYVAGVVALILLAAGQSVPWIFGAIVTRLLVVRLRVVSWLAFAIGIYVALFIPAIFPWTPAGGLAHWPVLLQTAEAVGERGTSFVLAIACGLVADAAARMRIAKSLRVGTREIAIAGGIFLVVIVYGAIRSSSIDTARENSPHAKVALLQPDFDAFFRSQEHKSALMIERLTTLTKKSEEAGAVLTVWPESAYPYTLAHGTKRQPLGNKAILQGGVKGPVLTGAYLAKGGGIGTNSAILVMPDGSIGPSYDKRHLLWFGETVPLGDTFPVLRRIFARGTGLDSGNESIAFQTGPITAAVLNCYEDTLPIAGREAMEISPTPNLLINITNDAWFAGSGEGELHLRLAVLRAIETRRDLVRAVNRGPTTWVDATGRIRERRDATEGLGPSPPLIADAALLSTPRTLYTRWGDWPLALLIAVGVVGPYLRRRKQNEAGAPPMKEDTPDSRDS